MHFFMRLLNIFIIGKIFKKIYENIFTFRKKMYKIKDDRKKSKKQKKM